MLERIKYLFRVYPFAIFAILALFAVYYFIFGIVQHNNQDLPITEAESMFSNQQNSLVDAPLLKGVVTAKVSSIPIWQTPSMDSMLTGVLTPQKEVIVLEEEDEWLFVGDSGSNSALGWVLKNDVKFVEEAFEETPNPRQETVLLPQIIEQKKQQEQQEVVYYTSKIPSLNVRELPSTNAPVIGKLTPANKVRIVENHYEWVKIEEVNVPSFKSGWVIYQSLKEQ